MADNLPRLSSIPSRLLEDNSGLKATPRRGLAEFRSTPGQGQSDKKNPRGFGGQTLTPTCLQGTFSARKKSNVTLTIYEDPAVTVAPSEMVEKEPIAESDEEIDTCDRDSKKDEESLLEMIMDGMETRKMLDLIEEEEYERPSAEYDDDAKTIIFGYEDDNLSLYSISSQSEDEEMEEFDEEGAERISKYFNSPYGVATNFDEIYNSLDVMAHESDTEIESDVRCSGITI